MGSATSGSTTTRTSRCSSPRWTPPRVGGDAAAARLGAAAVEPRPWSAASGRGLRSRRCALALAADLGVEGEVVGVDASAEMIAAARSRARAATCRTRFAVGDASALDEPDDSFDVVRSERMLQWLTSPEAAVAEMARVLRPGGLVSLVDTDWSTFEIDVGDDDLATRVRDAMRTERRRPSNIGRRLADLVQDFGFELVAQTTATQNWNAWDPDESPAPEGCFSMSSLADDLVDAGQLEVGDREWFVSTIHAAARQGRFSMALTMFAVVAAAPTTAF